MLHCIYHPVHDMEVVEDEEKERKLATGEWFDHPLKAKELRKQVEDRIAKKAKASSTKKVRVKNEKNEKNG